jgi:hypothetical protein
MQEQKSIYTILLKFLREVVDATKSIIQLQQEYPFSWEDYVEALEKALGEGVTFQRRTPAETREGVERSRKRYMELF